MNRVLLLLTLALAGPAPVLAQAPVTDPLLGAILELPRGATLRIAGDGEVTMGRLVPSESVDQLSLSVGAGTRSVPFSAVDSLWVRRRPVAGSARIGAGVGAVLGGVWGMGIAEDDCGCTGEAAFAGALIGALQGALVGVLVGVVTPRWHRVFPRDRPANRGVAP